ncbi:MAG: hypothetical protein LBS72_09115 [Oscillospiraceae bacterium]|jgi:hypothetical protein|nr:hypothetical protein [Oscillospiraceae bacterium]
MSNKYSAAKHAYRIAALLITIMILLMPYSIADAAAVADDAPEPLTAEDFLFRLGETVFALNTPASLFVEAVEATTGELAMIECEACLFNGLDREYSNEELVFATYPSGPDGIDMLESILVIGGIWTTERGVGIGDSMAEVELAYGTNYILDYNQMLYALGDPDTSPILVFQLDGEAAPEASEQSGDVQGARVDTESLMVEAFFLFNNTQVD